MFQCSLLHELLLSRRNRGHSSSDFVPKIATIDYLSRTLISSGEEAADHDAVSPGDQCFCNVSGISDPTVCYEGNSSISRNLGTIGYCRKLRNSGAGNYSRYANRPASNAHLYGVSACFDKIESSLAGRDVSRDQLDI